MCNGKAALCTGWKTLESLPELRHSWDLSRPPLLAHTLHQIGPRHLCLQPHLQTKVRDNTVYDISRHTAVTLKEHGGVFFKTSTGLHTVQFTAAKESKQSSSLCAISDSSHDAPEI